MYKADFVSPPLSNVRNADSTAPKHARKVESASDRAAQPVSHKFWSFERRPINFFSTGPTISPKQSYMFEDLLKANAISWTVPIMFHGLTSLEASMVARFRQWVLQRVYTASGSFC